MDFRFCHSMPGRIRLSIPALGQNRKLGEICLGWLRAQDGIRTARINYDCASLVLEYDPAHEQRLLLLLNSFKRMSLADLKALGAGAAQYAGAQRASVPEVSKRSPLALPTLSLFMALSANPVITAINMPLMLWNAIPIAKRAWKVWANESRLNIDVLDTLAISASVLQGNPLAGCIVTWLIKLGD